MVPFPSFPSPTVMSTLAPGRGTSISKHLCVLKRVLQNTDYNARYVQGGEVSCVRTKIRACRTSVTPDKAEVRQANEADEWIATDAFFFQFDAIERDAFEILRLVRSWRNSAAPIHRIPPEILTLLPDFWDTQERDQDVIVLTHVCQAWRQLFTSRSSLWAVLDCTNADKTRVYLERSKSFSLNLSLCRRDSLSPHDPFFQITPHVIGRLKSLSVWGTPENMQDIASQLHRPAPILEYLSIIGDYTFEPERIPVLTSTIFGGDLSLLRKLYLQYVHTEFPWRNMVNLTSLRLSHTLPVSTRQVLDFLGSAPHLRRVKLDLENLISDAQRGRLVPLTRLEKMDIVGEPSSVLLNHLLIPAGARLALDVDLPSPTIEERPPRFLKNLKNLPDFTTIELIGGPVPSMQFNGPNGEVLMVSNRDGTHLLLESLVLFNTAKTELLKIDFDGCPSSYPPFHTLLPMKELRTLELHQCESPYAFIQALDPGVNSLGVIACPKLEKLVITHRVTLDMKDIIKMAAERESRGVKLKSVEIVYWSPGTACAPLDMLELERHLSHPECR